MKKTFLSLMLLLASFAVGAYTNPILHSDYSDPDVICVDGEYWMVSSSFNCTPGLQILHSTDLVNWEIVNAGIPSELIPSEQFSSPSHGCGVWAPSIRYFNQTYWIFWGDPDNGVYRIRADHPAGKWSRPALIWKGKGLIDPCPLMDKDGRIYLVHAFAGSRAGFKSVLAVAELDKQCFRVIGEHILVFDGKKSGNETIEGPKFYKRNGWYYIFAPAGGVKEGWQLVLRSRNVYGPYECRKVLHQGSTDIHGPHQGGWVEDAVGNSWFLHFEDRYAYGRVVHLQPMEWTDDGWCTMGRDNDGDGIGEPVLKHFDPAPFPAVESYPRAVPALATETGFTHEYIPLNWQWNANRSDDWAMTCPSEGCIRLNCIQNAPEWKNLWDTPNLLLEKVVGPEMTLQAKLIFRPSYEGDRTGIVMMGEDYSTMELTFEDGTVLLRRMVCEGADKGAVETQDGCPVCMERDDDGSARVWMRITVRKGGLCSFYYSQDGKKYSRFGSDFKMKAGRWIGAKTGFFAIAKVKKNDGGTVDVY